MGNTKTKQIKFVKETDGKWYADIGPVPIPKSSLEMVEGADYWCEMMAQGASEISAYISDFSFPGAEVAVLKKPREGGGEYLVPRVSHVQVDLDMWLCPVVRYVFGYLPQHIYWCVKEEYSYI